MRSLTLIFTFFIISITCFAQEGNMYVQNYDASQDFGSNTSILQTEDGILSFANAKGVLTYDGVEWNLEEVTGTAFVLKRLPSFKNKIFVGGKEYFGILEKLKTGKYKFREISNKFKEIGLVTDIATTNENIYFYTNHKIYHYNTQSKKTVAIEAPKQKIFTGWFVHKGELIINIQDKGLSKLKGSKFVPLTTEKSFSNINIQTFFKFDKTKTMVGTSDNKLYLYDDKTFSRFNTSAQNYLFEFVLRQGISISKEKIALSTASGGCLIINKKDGKATNVINSQSGLIDDEISAIALDKESGLWISHKSGISRVPLNLPVTAYSSFSGLEGRVTNVLKHKYWLYVGTDKGVFYLTQKGWNDNVSRQHAKSAVAIQVAPHYFKKVPNIDAKCKQLLQYKGRMLVATNSGLYAVNMANGRASTILGNNYISTAYGDSKRGMLYVSTENGLLALNERYGWAKSDTLRMFKEEVGSIIAHDGYLWLGGLTQITRVKLKKDGTFGKHKTYRLKSSLAEHVKIVIFENKPLFITSKGAFKYSDFLGGILLPHKKLSAYFFTENQIISNQQNSLWMNHQREWRKIQSELKKENRFKYPFISLFTKVRDIFQDEESNLWVVGDGKIYKIDKDAKPKQVKNNAFVRSAVSENGKMHALDNLSIDQDSKTRGFSLHIALPSYLAEQNNMFQYRIKGINDGNWTPFRGKALLDFPYLPSGRYKLELRARNALGQETETKEFPFRINPPFWETWWFYILEILILLGLLIGSIVYNKKHKNSKIASVITLVTIITFFEFIVLIIEPYVDSISGGVPIFKLIMNILLAFNLIPLEKKVKGFIENNTYFDKIEEKFNNNVETSDNKITSTVKRTYQKINENKSHRNK